MKFWLRLIAICSDGAKDYLSDVLLIGASTALLGAFIYMRIVDYYVAIENNMVVYFGEVTIFAFMLGWGIYSLVRKLK